MVEAERLPKTMADVFRSKGTHFGCLHRGDIDPLILGRVLRSLFCFALGVSCQELLHGVTRVALKARVGTESGCLPEQQTFDGVGERFVVLGLDRESAEIE